MALLDLRTLYKGELKSGRKRIEEANTISETMTNFILEVLEKVKESDQTIIRKHLIELAEYETQLADMVTRADYTNAETIVIEKLKFTLDNLRKTITRVERVLMSTMNSDNNAR